MCISRARAFIFSLYFPFDLNYVQVNENGLSKDPSVKKKNSKTNKNGYCYFKSGKIYNGNRTITTGYFFTLECKSTFTCLNSSNTHSAS